MEEAELVRVTVVTTAVDPEPVPPVPPVVIVVPPVSGPPAFPLLEQPTENRGSASTINEAMYRI